LRRSWRRCWRLPRLPLFLFLDPTGLGLPYDVLVRLLTEKRRDGWPPTEVLLNFSLDAVRRIGGHVGLISGVHRAPGKHTQHPHAAAARSAARRTDTGVCARSPAPAGVRPADP